MSLLFVCEQGSKISFSNNRFEVSNKELIMQSIPAETLEAIEIFGNSYMTTPCIHECLLRGIPVTYYSSNGKLYGNLNSSRNVNVSRQRLQAEIEHNDAFKLEFSKLIIDAKIRNQMVVLRRYSRNTSLCVNDELQSMKALIKALTRAASSEAVMGYEGSAARVYFKTLGKLITPEFSFCGRNKRPPMDPFNALISLGYSILLNEVFGKIESKGLNPYFGVLHKDKEKHPALASDLMEEWRPVLVDTTAMSVLNGHEILTNDFVFTQDEGVRLTKQSLMKYIRRIEQKLDSPNNYLSYLPYPVSFRRSLESQVAQYIKAMEQNDSGIYHPVIIR